MNIYALKTTKDHKKYWEERQIDWRKDYLSTWNHPHRYIISDVLKRIYWISLIEIGCGAGANLVNIIKNIPGKQLGGIDINPQAIEVANSALTNGTFKVCSADDIMMSDKSTDVSLSDMTYIYVGPRKINKYIKELKRITRNYVVLCEFHHTSWWKRLKLKLTTGYNAYNYKKLLEEHGFYDIDILKVPPQAWEGGQPQKTFAYIIIAKLPKRG